MKASYSRLTPEQEKALVPALIEQVRGFKTRPNFEAMFVEFLNNCRKQGIPEETVQKIVKEVRK